MMMFGGCTVWHTLYIYVHRIVVKREMNERNSIIITCIHLFVIDIVARHFNVFMFYFIACQKFSIHLHSRRFLLLSPCRLWCIKWHCRIHTHVLNNDHYHVLIHTNVCCIKCRTFHHFRWHSLAIYLWCLFFLLCNFTSRTTNNKWMIWNDSTIKRKKRKWSWH